MYIVLGVGHWKPLPISGPQCPYQTLLPPNSFGRVIIYLGFWHTRKDRHVKQTGRIVLSTTHMCILFAKICDTDQVLKATQIAITQQPGRVNPSYCT